MARTLVGLDIGSSGIRAAELVPGRRRQTVRRFADVPLSPGVVRNGAVVDPAALTAALRELWSVGKLGTRTVRLGIANASVLVRQLDLDWMPPADFRKALRYQVADALPMPVDDATLDYHLLDELDLPGEKPGEAPRRVARVLLVAAAREMVQAYLDAAAAAKLRVVGVDLVPFALVRSRAPRGLDQDAVTEAIVDVGADVVTVVVHTGGAPRFVRIIAGAGGDTITEAVRSRYDWTWEEAERTKVYAGLPGHAHLDDLQRSVVGVREDGLDHAAQTVVAAAAGALVDEIGTTLDFYRGPGGMDGGLDGDMDGDMDGPETDSGQDDGSTAAVPVPAEQPAPISRVVLTGDGARLAGFRELLGQRLGLEVEDLDVLGDGALRLPRRVRSAADGGSALAVTAGLCVGAGR